MIAQLGDRLREERQKTGRNQQAFAALAGASRNSQVDYELGRTAPNTDYLLLLANHGVDAGYVLTGRRTRDSIAADLSALIASIENLTPAWRDLVVMLVEQATMSARTEGGVEGRPRTAVPPPLSLPTEPVLVRMFEALLLGIDPQAELDEQAQLLARRLPIALSQVQDVLPGSDRQPVPIPEHASDPASRAKHRHEPTQ